MSALIGQWRGQSTQRPMDTIHWRDEEGTKRTCEDDEAEERERYKEEKQECVCVTIKSLGLDAQRRLFRNCEPQRPVTTALPSVKRVRARDAKGVGGGLCVLVDVVVERAKAAASDTRELRI